MATATSAHSVRYPPAHWGPIIAILYSIHLAFLIEKCRFSYATIVSFGPAVALVKDLYIQRWPLASSIYVRLWKGCGSVFYSQIVAEISK